MMWRIVLTIAAITAALVFGAVYAGAGPALSGEALRGAVGDKTVILTVSGFEFPIRYSSHGTMTGAMGAVAVAFSRDEAFADHGTWWVKGKQLCQRWSTWMEGRTHCYTLDVRGHQVHWQRDDGQCGIATIVP